MRDVDLFDDRAPIERDLLFTKVVRITWEINYDYLYLKLKDLNYESTNNAKEEILRIAVQSNAVSQTEEALQKYWERLVSHLNEKYGYTKPVSYSSDAVRKRRARMNRYK